MAIEADDRIGRSLTKTVQHVYRTEGLRAFYQGMYPSLIGIIPCHGTGFLIFHYLKNKTQEKYPEWHQSKITDFAFGAFSGVFAQFSLSFLRFN